ncbi:MAG TPA: hypothetical protein PLZ51_28765, partial [Aggregatilineales bacterium]|nr:hypothetical protein [Aggregatilineales bacterium]
ISSGDTPFDIVDDSGILRDDYPLGSHTINGPISTTNLRVVEQGGNTETLNLTDQNCFLSNALTATAICNGASLEITISNGNAPFTINVNGDVTTGNPLGVYPFTGPNTFTIIIDEEAGDFETFTPLPVTCTAPIVPVIPAAPVVLSPDLTALGCVLTQDVLAPTAPNNTYCRVLMKNGAVINYSGAVPRSLVDLGVIYAVDVYRLEGGQSLTDFGGYQQVCLAGQGRLFYLDARTSPRIQTELATEN